MRLCASWSSVTSDEVAGIEAASVTAAVTIHSRNFVGILNFSRVAAVKNQLAGSVVSFRSVRQSVSQTHV